MKNINLKVKENLKAGVSKIKKHKKRIIKVVIGAAVVLVVGLGSLGGYKYYHAKSNVNFSQDQLKEVALSRVPGGEVVKVEQELNFRRGVFEYDFKIKDSNNMLREVRLDSEYGTIVQGRHGKCMIKGERGMMNGKGDMMQGKENMMKDKNHMQPNKEHMGQGQNGYNRGMDK